MNTNALVFCRMTWPSLGIRAAIEVNIRTLMPLPTPRSVISSPSHMMTPVPAVMVTTMIAREFRSWWYSGCWQSLPVLPNSWPDRASAMKPVDWRIASPMVR